MNPATIPVRNMLIAPVAKTNSATASASLDTLGYDYASIAIQFKAELNTNAVGPTLSLLESDDTVVTNHATVTANRTNEDLTNARLVVYNVDLKGRKRYLRLTVTTATATNDDITVSSVAYLWKEDLPTSTTGMVATTNDIVVTV